MKRIFFSFMLLAAFAVGAQAQSSGCAKSCTGKSAAACQTKVAGTSTTIGSDHAMAAAKIASLDPTIEPRKNQETGEVSYVRKETNPHDGTVSYAALNFDATTSTFVNVGPSKMEAPAGCSSHATTTSGKSCCAAGAASKSCCAGKTKSASLSSSTNSGAEVKPVKTAGGSK